MSKEIKVLLLNQSYEPLAGIPLRKAIKHIVKNKAEVLHYDNRKINYGNGYYSIPVVIRLISNEYVNAHKFEPRYNKKGIYRRDNYTCAYCGQKFKDRDLSIDHIVPKSKGGINSWTNCITACKKCNSYKADFSIEETKMYLRFKPYIPYNSIFLNCREYLSNIWWKKYIPEQKVARN